MEFRASNLRIPIPPKRVGVGTPITPSAAIPLMYVNQVSPLIGGMLWNYAEELGKILDTEQAKHYFDATMDASIASMFKKILNKLKREWQARFKEAAAVISNQFVDETEKAATGATMFSLKTAGIVQPRNTYTLNVRETVKSAKILNNTLITGIADDIHSKIFEAVMLSLTSENPEEQGAYGIVNALKREGIKQTNRLKLIADDQTSKLYSSLAIDRMKENGVEEFEWIHSGGGKTPRIAHLQKDGQIFKINDPRLWEGRPQDVGPPGWAINCRCRMRPIV